MTSTGVTCPVLEGRDDDCRGEHGGCVSRVPTHPENTRECLTYTLKACRLEAMETRTYLCDPITEEGVTFGKRVW